VYTTGCCGRRDAIIIKAGATSGEAFSFVVLKWRSPSSPSSKPSTRARRRTRPPRCTSVSATGVAAGRSILRPLTLPDSPIRPARRIVGILKSKIAKLKSEIILGPKSAGSSKPGDGFDVTRFGDTRVGLIGFPSVGKSTLLNVLTGGKSESAVAAYEFTTLTW
jgi:hypothetical protein